MEALTCHPNHCQTRQFCYKKVMSRQGSFISSNVNVKVHRQIILEYSLHRMVTLLLQQVHRWVLLLLVLPPVSMILRQLLLLLLVVVVLKVVPKNIQGLSFPSRQRSLFQSIRWKISVTFTLARKGQWQSHASMFNWHPQQNPFLPFIENHCIALNWKRPRQGHQQ